MNEKHMREIAAIVDRTPHLPNIFRVIMGKQSVLSDGEEVLDSVFIDREGCEVFEDGIRKTELWKPATLLVATDFGITVIREGGALVATDFYGYRIDHVLYGKIARIGLDICLLSGRFYVSSCIGADEGISVDFNTAVHFRDFERFVTVVRKRLFHKDL
ncbi:MAG: hypothetical protein NT080_06045 [Spirochaetes bacterium]|nr:hypothetical protein [Spirochaetota bacterium]